MKTKDDIIKQLLFCNALFLRLQRDINNAEEESAMKVYLHNYSRMQDDIKRIRRELLILSKMLNPWNNSF